MLEKRLDMKVGFLCNNNCRFCVVADKRKFGNFSTLQIKNHLKEGIKNGAKDVVFTGGEPTIRKDILELVSYAKDLGYKNIQLQSNGRMLCYTSFIKKLIKAGITEFGPALHGHIPKLHDFLTRSPGAWNQTVDGIKNLRKLDQYIIMNSVITKPNYRYLPELAKLFIELEVDQFQFAFVHASGNAYLLFDQIVPWISLAAPFIHNALDIGKGSGIRMMVEAVPYCLMQGYEKYCSEFYIPPSEIRELGGVTPDFEIVRKTEGKLKGMQCKKCKYYIICEGPWREYPEKRGFDEFVPVKGKKIKNINVIKDKFFGELNSC